MCPSSDHALFENRICKRMFAKRKKNAYAMKLRKNVCLTVLKKAFAKCLKNLTVNSLYEGASAFIEHPLESITLALQNFHETIYIVFYKRSESV